VFIFHGRFVLVVVRVDRVSLASRRGRASAAPRTHIPRHKTSASASERAFSVDFLGSCHKKFPPYLTILHTKKSKITITITTDHLDHRPSLSPRRPPPPHPNNPMTMMGRKQHTAAALALTAVASSMPSAVAFSASQRLLSPTSNTYRYRASTSIFAESTPSSSSPDKLYATKTIEEGSHDELMYTLGVNLARQLGDVRPLVETSEELTHLARGLLDAIVGKLDDAEQMKLLARRGEDLNNIILERA